MTTSTASSSSSSGGTDGGSPCLESAGDRSGTTTLSAYGSQATATLADPSPCQRTFTLQSTAPLRDNLPSNPRSVTEQAGQPSLDSSHTLLDALFALAIQETRENSVTALSDGAYNNGVPVACPSGGCFQTGRLWTWAWTRDVSFSVDLGLGVLDPVRAMNTLLFKLSPRRDGTDLQVVQDTGTGGSYPVSTDRVVWALGASSLLAALEGTARTAFRDTAYTALVNTLEHDRVIAFDDATGLYRGETSFLDWREQTYASWVAQDVVHVGMSRALSTNVLHLQALRLASALAAEKGAPATSTRYADWAGTLESSIRSRLLAGARPSAYLVTELDLSPVSRRDLLAESLAILAGLADDVTARAWLTSYPFLVGGPPVTWPQQKETRIYHNRASWPFVTAYMLLAARHARHGAALHEALQALVRGAALNLSNMENMEAVTGAALLDDGIYSGPVVNSQRQLWSVAGFVAAITRGIVGLEHGPAGMRVRPLLPMATRASLLAGTSRITFNHHLLHGREVHVVINLPATSGAALLEPGAVRINGTSVDPAAWVDPASLPAVSTWEVDVVPAADGPTTITRITDVTDYRVLFGPRAPAITAVGLAASNVQVTWDAAGENDAEVTFNVYRDGLKVASAIPGNTRSWTDPDGTAAARTTCYAVETVFTVSGLASQHSAPACWWGASFERVQSFPASQFVAVGGSASNNHGRFHYEAWGDEGHSLAVPVVTPTRGGAHLLQVVHGNGGDVSTGLTCGIKRLRVIRNSDDVTVAEGHLVMPHLGTWDAWKDSSFVRANLVAGTSYRVVIDSGAAAVNMSAFRSSERYTGGPGGASGVFNRVNIAEVKLLNVEVP